MIDDRTDIGLSLFERVVVTSPLTVPLELSVADVITKMHDTRSSYAIVVSSQLDSQADRPLEHPSKRSLERLSPKLLSPEHLSEKAHIAGLFTERDIVRAIAAEQPFDELKIADVMSIQIPTVQAEDVTSVTEIFVRMRQLQARYLPVVQSSSGQLAGIITRRSLRQALTAPSLLKFKSVSDVMVTQVMCLSQTDLVIRAAQLMASQDSSCVIITNKEDLPVGIITERDIVQFKALDLDLYSTCAAQVMSTPLLPITAQDSLWLAHQKMNQHRIRRLVVCTLEGRLVGLLTQENLLQALDLETSQQMVALLQQEVSQLRAENQTLLEAQNRELQQEQLNLNRLLLCKQRSQQQTQAQLEAAYHELEESYNALNATNKELNNTLQELRSTKRALQQANIELEGQVESRTFDLLRAEGRWQSLLEEVHLVVIGLDLDGKINYANPFFLRLTGYSAKEVLGKYWFENFVPRNEYERTYEYFQTFIEDRELPLCYQNAILTRSRSERMIAWHNVALRDHADNVVGTMSIGEDITDQLAVDRMKGEFVSVVSHELRTPLTSIHGSLQLITSGLVASSSNQGQELLQVASQSSQRLVRLVDDILELERLESGKVQIHKKKVVSQEITSQVVKTFQAVAKSKEITTILSDPGLMIAADSDRITQVLTTLLDNAVKFSPEQTTIKISVERSSSSRKTEVMALFKVKDQGRGIPSERLSEIFERFTQIDYDDAREMGGTGLGLAICHNIICQHEGNIWVESTLGEGSCFFFTVPLYAQ